MDFIADEDDTGSVLVSDDIVDLNNAWRSEVHSPDILPYRHHLIRDISDRLHTQQRNISDRINSPEEIFTASLYQMDIDRVRYALARYLRARILKIERMSDDVIRGEVLDRLSIQEKTFVSKLNNLNNAYLEESFFGRLQEGAKEKAESAPDRRKHAQPALQDFVFCRTLADIEVPNEYGDPPARYARGDMFIAKYDDIKEFVVRDEIILI